MPSFRILKQDQGYTFSDYFRLNYTIRDILEELDCGFVRDKLDLPTTEYDIARVNELKLDIEFNIRQVDLANEDARKQVVIAPILLDLCRTLPLRMNIEYPIKVNDYLKGVIDYYLQKEDNLIVVEAKQADLVRGFTQLAVELIAVDQWTDSTSSILYGAVTTGDIWRFGCFNRVEQRVTEDIDLYVVPKDLQQVMNILFGILAP